MKAITGLLPFLIQTVRIVVWGWKDTLWKNYVLRMLDLRLHRFARFSEFVTLYESYFHHLESKNWYEQFYPYQAYLTGYVLPFLNLFHKIKVLRGVEDGQWLIKYMKLGAKEIHYFCGIDGRTSHNGTLHRIPGSRNYIPRTSGLKRKDFDVRKPKTWDVGIVRSVNAAEAAKLYQKIGGGKSYDHFRAIHNFSTSLFNSCAEGDD